MRFDDCSFSNKDTFVKQFCYPPVTDTCTSTDSDGEHTQCDEHFCL